jgi:predicted esterase
MGPWRKVGDLASSKLRFYLFTREQDFNRPATQNLKEVMAAKGCRVTEVEAPGGHAPIESGQLEPALSWLIEA